MEYTRSLWREQYERLEFSFEGRLAVVVLPRAEKNGKWLLKTEYFGAFQDMEEAMVARGWTLVYLENINRWGRDEDQDAKSRLALFLVEEFGLNRKCVPVGMSCGGLHAIKLAARHPEMTAGVYLDAPVVNLLSCPFGLGAGTTLEESAKQEALDALGLTMQDMIAYREHPLDKLPILLENRIPAALVWGDTDSVVVFEENGLHVKSAYEKTDIPCLFQTKHGCGHHPHGPAEMEEMVRFLENMYHAE